jgi:hypothetical protein
MLKIFWKVIYERGRGSSTVASVRNLKHLDVLPYKSL